jgi:DNA-binding NtrC family response regulator
VATILVIDDEELVLNLISKVLKAAGHDVTAISNPTSVLEQFHGELVKIDLIVSDIDMPGKRGFELAYELNAAGFHGQILFMSGYPTVLQAVSDMFGTKLTLSKPFTASQLRTTVAAALAA